MRKLYTMLGIRGSVWVSCLAVGLVTAASIVFLADAPAAAAAIGLAVVIALGVMRSLLTMDEQMERLREHNAMLMQGHDQLSSDLATHVERAFTAEVERARRHGRPLSVLVLCSEPQSLGRDAALDLRELVQPALRASDLIARFRDTMFPGMPRTHDLTADRETWLNDALLLLLPETNRRGAEAAAEKLRRLASERLGSTIGVGIAVLPDDGRTPLDLIEEAQKALLFDEPRPPDESQMRRLQASNRRPATAPYVFRLLKWAVGF